MMQRSIGGILASAERASIPDVAAARKRLVSIHYICLKREMDLETSNEKD